MTEQLQSDLLELEELKGIRIAVSDDEEALFIGFSYWQKNPRDRVFAWLCWTAVAILYGACGLILWWVATRA
jgi:hypothetical protein